MTIDFPSREFDDAVAAVCHDSPSAEQVSALNELMRRQAAARDEYILRLELHSRLASEPDLFTSPGAEVSILGADRKMPLPKSVPNKEPPRSRNLRTTWVIALAACLALMAAGLWNLRLLRPAAQNQPISKAIAMLNRTADAQWNQSGEIPRLGAALEPGWLRLEAGLAEIIFYSGVRLVMEGPAEVQIISRNDALCKQGRVVADVPDQARGFQIRTPHTVVTDMGTSSGLDVKEQMTEVHAFKGDFKVGGGAPSHRLTLLEGSGTLIENTRAPRLMVAEPASFASLFDLEARSAAAGARRRDQWRKACQRLETDPTLLVHLDFENVTPSGWQLPNLRKPLVEASDATLVGCQWTEGRWPEKRALEFQSVSDRVRLTVPGEFQALTLTAWVSVKGLDRTINSLFMSDGFEPGTVHWLIRRDGVLGMTVIGTNAREHQIVASPPVIALDKFGTWLHLAVTVDSSAKQVTHYVNGVPVSEKNLKIAPPFRIGAAELGNWNAKGFPENDPFMIRNFSGAMDDFCVLGRALSAHEIRALYSQGKPQPEPVVQKPK